LNDIPVRHRVSDFVELTKPTITLQCALVTALGAWLAPGELAAQGLVAAIVGCSAVVASANALNMWLERHSDGLMSRTKNRPLPAGRMDPNWALAFGLLLGAISIGVLGWGTNALTAAIAAASLVVYVAIYTPLKRQTPLALLIGAFPGAAPILMGWTATTNHIDPAALALFTVMLLWQMPHFLAIALYRKAEYERAGIRVVPVVRGDHVAKAQAIAYSTALIPTSLAVVPLGVGGWVYAFVALVAGLWLLVLSIQGLSVERTARWARKLFVATLVYIPAVAVALVVDTLLR
jgi:protoheme IX farnesyltransferase